MKRRLTLVFLAMIVAVAFMPASAFAASKVKMTAYDSVVKDGNTIYVAGAGNSLYKAKLKKGKVKSRSQIKGADDVMGDYSYVTSMKKKGKYLYYVEYTEGTVSYLKRVKISSGKAKTLAKQGTAYAIKGNKIYVEIWNEDADSASYRVMNLTGGSKKKTSKRPSMKTVKTKGYAAVYKEKDTNGDDEADVVYTYVKTPKGTYYLGKSKVE